MRVLLWSLTAFFLRRKGMRLFVFFELADSRQFGMVCAFSISQEKLFKEWEETVNDSSNNERYPEYRITPSYIPKLMKFTILQHLAGLAGARE